MLNRAAVLYEPLVVRIEEREAPSPGPRDVLVQVSAVGVCGSDVHFFEHGHIGDVIVESPMILGHEASGVVVSLGSDVRNRVIGERVSLEPGVPCSVCAQCRSGFYNLCPDVVFFGTPPVDGAFAQYVTINEEFAYPVPDSVSDLAAALIEPFSVGLWAVKNARVAPGDRVLVTGAGPVGVLSALAAKIAGASSVTITDVNVHRLAVAASHGIDRTIDVSKVSLAEIGEKFDVLIECSGVPEVARQGIRSLRPRGVAILVGLAADGNYELPVGFIQNREIEIRGTYRYANTYPKALRLVEAEMVDLDSLVTDEFSLDQSADALQASRTDPAAMKVVVRPKGGRQT